MIARMLAALLVMTGGLAFAAQDDEGCKDPPLLNRMPGFHIYRCDMSSEFDTRTFRSDSKGAEVAVEGRVTEILYTIDEGRAPVSALQIVRNYENAVARIGGKVVAQWEDGGTRYSTLRLQKGGSDHWIQVDSGNPVDYHLMIVEKKAMAQEVTANADALRAGLAASGHVEVPGILFDTGKSTLRPESDAALAELAKVLQGDPGLRVFVVGHTDNQGVLASNLTLSAARADAVVKALVAKHKVDARRLAPFGAGPYAPVASNASEDGRSRNRRVELVAQ
jgi:outer membrane protein OmpA-like peptidoglycan-associated protein